MRSGLGVVTLGTLVVMIASPSAVLADYQRVAVYPISLRGNGLPSGYIGDFDGDQRLEIVGAEGLSVAIFDLLTGAQEFVDQYVGQTTNFSVEDFDSDGLPEILASFEGNATALYDYVGAGAAPPTEQMLPSATRLLPAHPNPFNPSTAIPFALDSPGHVELELIDVQGRLIRRLVAGRLDAGSHEITWDGRDANGRPVASGQYFYTLIVGGAVIDKSRAVILK
jgi:hypothetical protein